MHNQWRAAVTEAAYGTVNGTLKRSHVTHRTSVPAHTLATETGVTNPRSRRPSLGCQTARPLVAVAIVFVASLAASPAHAAENSRRMTMHLRLDNDMFATGSDRGYTNGFQLGFTSPTVESFTDPALPRSERAVSRPLKWLQPRGYQENNVTVTLSQGMFTPDESELNPPDPLDRPYAGLLVAGIQYNGRDATTMRSTRLDVGLVGPSALAEQTQDIVHDALGADEFLGWDHQLDNEPIVRVLHQRLRKWDLRRTPRMMDAIVHYGGSIGNLNSFASVGGELRFGRVLPDDFGTAPAPQGGSIAPSRAHGLDRRPTFHAFVGLDARYVAHDITLDGNTWRDSPSVEREPLVADLALGFATYMGAWQITVARYFRTQEFETEQRDTTFGSITFRRAPGRRSDRTPTVR
jgi:hypothetical protein